MTEYVTIPLDDDIIDNHNVEELQNNDEQGDSIKEKKPYQPKTKNRKIIEATTIATCTALLGGLGGSAIWAALKIYRENEKKAMTEKPEEEKTWYDKSVKWMWDLSKEDNYGNIVSKI
tara:strand:+ start:55 stop:408 length:354 start_codon:yes stop_codon:yes gene_type:complete